MESLFCLAYTSSATRMLMEVGLEKLLTDARSRNWSLGVTGVLLYDDGNFFQYLEGQRQALHQVYERIQHSRQHHNLIELVQQPIQKREFLNWNMGLCRVMSSELLRLSSAAWSQDLLTAQSNEVSQSDGLVLLLDFWLRAGRWLHH
ncbi:MAG: BLUF domain-containing protein [Burkholderiales bacterium]